MLKVGKMGEGVPIILVPSAFQTLITIYNVKQFLEDAVFVPTDAKVKQMKGSRPDCITVQKKFSRDREKVMQAYEVRDKPSALKPEGTGWWLCLCWGKSGSSKSGLLRITWRFSIKLLVFSCGLKMTAWSQLRP